MSERFLRWYDTPGHLMCCLCFEQVPLDELCVCEHGQKWDICKNHPEEPRPC